MQTFGARILAVGEMGAGVLCMCCDAHGDGWVDGGKGAKKGTGRGDGGS